MKNTMKRTITIITMLAVILTMMAPMQAQAKAKPKLNKTSVKLTITDKKAAPATTLKVKNATKKELKKATWQSSNKKVATVSKSGKITGKGKGKATVTVKVNGKKLTCKVTVLDKRTPIEPEPSETKCSHDWEEHWTVFEAEDSGNDLADKPKAFCKCGAFLTNEEFDQHRRNMGIEIGILTKMEKKCGIHGTKAKNYVTSRKSSSGEWYWNIRTEYIEYMECKTCGERITGV